MAFGGPARVAAVLGLALLNAAAAAPAQPPLAPCEPGIEKALQCAYEYGQQVGRNDPGASKRGDLGKACGCGKSGKPLYGDCQHNHKSGYQSVFPKRYPSPLPRKGNACRLS